MKSSTTKSDSSPPVADTAVYLFDDWFDPIEAAVRDRVRGFIQAMIEGELDEKLQRPRYGRRPKSLSSVDDGGTAVSGHRHGHRSRSPAFREYLVRRRGQSVDRWALWRASANHQPCAY